jgi:hypothetical protein
MRTSARFIATLASPDALKPALGLASLLLTCALVACKTHSPSQYVAPRVMGRVLDQQTHQPIPDVRVRRIRPEGGAHTRDTPKGGQLMEQSPAARTGKDGTFVLQSVRDLVLFRMIGWYSVSLSFEHTRYERFVADYTLANATNTAKGEPVVNTGDILLTPRAN